MQPDGGHSDRVTAFADRLDPYDRLVEVAIGRRTDLAALLADRGHAVTATDVSERPVPDGVAFVVDDVTDPDLAVYEGADAIYASNLPPELQRPVLEIAGAVDATLVFTTLGGDPPTVAVRREAIPGDTLFWARES